LQKYNAELEEDIDKSQKNIMNIVENDNKIKNEYKKLKTENNCINNYID
jgi:hypothetical protein